MDLPSVGECTLRTIFLDMHSKEAHVHTINLLKGKKCFGSVGKRLRHFSSVHKPDVTKNKQTLVYLVICDGNAAIMVFQFITTKSHMELQPTGIIHSHHCKQCNEYTWCQSSNVHQGGFMRGHCLWADTALYNQVWGKQINKKQWHSQTVAHKSRIHKSTLRHWSYIRMCIRFMEDIKSNKSNICLLLCLNSSSFLKSTV